MELTGKIDEDGNFFIVTEDGPIHCLLFVTPEVGEGESAEEFDIDSFEAGPVTVICESFDGEDAWGVSQVIVLAAEGESEDEAEAEDEAEDEAEGESEDEADDAAEDEPADDEAEEAESKAEQAAAVG